MQAPLPLSTRFCCRGGCVHLQVEWTQELHERFVNAVETLGADKAVPSKILEHMGPIAAGLTRQNVASHLQKHRTRRRSQNDFCKAAPYCPPAAYHCWSPFSPPGAMIGAPDFCSLVPCNTRQHACWSAGTASVCTGRQQPSVREQKHYQSGKNGRVSEHEEPEA